MPRILAERRGSQRTGFAGRAPWIPRSVSGSGPTPNRARYKPARRVLFVDFGTPITWISLAASLATIITVLFSAGKYFSSKNAEKALTSENLYLELGDTLTSLDSSKFSDDFYNVDITDRSGNHRTAYFMGRSLNHDFYDSLIYSGKINFLDPLLQQRVQDIFKRIKTHNRFVDVVFEMVERNGGNMPVQAHKYCEWLEVNEKRLQQELPEMLDSLRSHFKMKRKA